MIADVGKKKYALRMKISWIPEEHLPLKGKLGLCRAPGSDAPSTDDDLESLVLQGVTRVVCLQQAHELKLLEPPESIEQRKESLNQKGIGFLHEPIQDFAAPSVELAQRIVSWINTELEKGEVVVVHCWAGLGRAGTIAACVLLSRGFSVHGAGSRSLCQARSHPKRRPREAHRQTRRDYTEPTIDLARMI